MTDHDGPNGRSPADEGDLIEIDLNFESMRRFQAEFSPNLSKDGLFIDTGEPLDPGSVIRFRVILPEEFVFLEGTSVVEWVRSAEAVSDGPPGMALRFVTLSPQNQELVEQLVDDHVDSGGTPFDVDVRPVPADFPTDALEGAPPAVDPTAAEGYRLTVRRTEPYVQAAALQALAGASPVADGDDPQPPSETEDGETEVAHGFEILSGPVDGKLSHADAAVDGDDGTPPVIPEPVDEPPALDWSAELEDSAGSQEYGLDDSAPSDEHTDASADGLVESVLEEAGILSTPVDFDDGPEVMGDVRDDDLGSPAFDISLPEEHDDDEPDTTPVLPDEGRDDVNIHTEDDPDVPVRRRRLWPFGLAAVFLLAVAIGLQWPRISNWYANRTAGIAEDSAAASLASATGVPPVGHPDGASPDTDIDSSGEPGLEVEGDEGASGPAAEIDPSETMADDSGTDDDVVPIEEREAAPERTSPEVGRTAATAVTAIDVEPGLRGTSITIRANGDLGDGTISMENLPSPPRVLVRLRGIRSDFRPYVIESATPEVTRVRIGLHDERRPSELWIVVDLADAEIAVQGIDIQGDVAVIEVARR